MMIKRTTQFSLTILVALLLGLTSSAAFAQGTLFVEGDRVGIGTDTPQSPLHIKQAVGEPNIRLETLDTEPVRFELINSAGEWEFIHGPVGNFNFNRVGQAGNQFIFTTNGNLIIQGSLSQGSSRTIKRGVEPVDGRHILEELVELPLSEWSYNGGTARHLGPMAEDFGAAFGLGSDLAQLAPADVAGVALAAIQGLNTELEEKGARIEALEQDLKELRNMVIELSNK